MQIAVPTMSPQDRQGANTSLRGQLLDTYAKHALNLTLASLATADDPVVLLGAGDNANLGQQGTTTSGSLAVSDDGLRRGPNWTLEGCCNETQTVICCLVAVYTVVIFFAWRWYIIRPFKILTVFLHELSHAGAAIVTCGKVVGMEVHGNEGGLTKTVGGSMWCILPAGYLGSAFWGMVFVICSADALAAQIGAGILGVALIGVLFVADNNTLRLLCIGFILLIAGFWALEILTVFQGMRYLLLFVGTMNGWFAVYDIHDDLISRRVHGSDAVKFAELTHTSSRCWGVVWAMISMVLMVLGVYLALVVASSSSTHR